MEGFIEDGDFDGEGRRLREERWPQWGQHGEFAGVGEVGGKWAVTMVGGQLPLEI